MPSPMPDAAPVMNAIFPARSFNRFSPYGSFWLPSNFRLRHCSSSDKVSRTTASIRLAQGWVGAVGAGPKVGVKRMLDQASC